MGEMRFDLVGEIVHVDDRALQADLGETVEHMVHQRLAADRHERLGHRIGDRAHARPEPGSEDHRGVRHRRDGVQRGCRRLGHGRPRQGCVAKMLGTFCSTHDLIPANAGCARFLRRYACRRGR